MEKLQVRMILEILGRPPENVVQALVMLVTNLQHEPGAKVVESTQHKPLPVKESQSLYTAFVELSLEVDSLYHLFTILYKYMPANIEISYPETSELKSQDLNVALNQLLQRLHNYDAITKRALAERDLILEQLKVEAPQAYKKLIQVPQASKQAKKKKPKKR